MLDRFIRCEAPPSHVQPMSRTLRDGTTNPALDAMDASSKAATTFMMLCAVIVLWVVGRVVSDA